MILYTIDNCPWCDVLKKRLDHAKIDYTVINGVAKLRAKGFLSAPQLELESGEVLAYQAAIERLNGGDLT